MSLVTKTITSGHVFTIVGEEIILSTEIPLRGWAELNLLSLAKTGNTGTRDLVMHYRFTKNGIVYNEWVEMSSFATIQSAIKEDFLVEFKIARTGTDTTGTVTLTSVTLQGDYNASYFSVWDFTKDTIFSDIAYDDYNWNKLWINLLGKLYERGIVPDYIERAEITEDDETDEEDYIVFWKVVAYFYALLSELSRRKTSGLRDDDLYLMEHLEQKGLFLCKSCTTCNADHIYIMENIFDEFRQRGTLQITVPKSAEKAVNGEMLRMICYDPKDELLFEYLPRHLSGWTMNRTSPIFRGKSGHIQLNKAPENTEDVLDLSKYVVSGDVSLITDGDKEVALLEEDGSLSFTTVVEPFLSYELNFWAKFSDPLVGMLTVQAEGFVNTTPSNLQKVSGGGVETKILDTVSMPNGTVYYHVKCFIHKKGTLIYGDDAKTSLLQGTNLKFTSVTTNKVKFTIKCEGAGNELRIWDIKCNPTIFDVSSVYINSYNVMNVYLINRNASTTIIEFEENMRRYMIPYGTVFQMFYSPKSQFSPEIFLAQNNSALLLQNNDGKFLI